MLQPCQDNYNKSFSTLTEMMRYHTSLARESTWESDLGKKMIGRGRKTAKSRTTGGQVKNSAAKQAYGVDFEKSNYCKISD